METNTDKRIHSNQTMLIILLILCAANTLLTLRIYEAYVAPFVK